MSCMFVRFQAGLTLLCNLMELAIVHSRVQSSASVQLSTASSSGPHVSWLQLDESQSVVDSDDLPVSFQLPVFIFRLSQIDLATATGVNPERSSFTLRHIGQLSSRLRYVLYVISRDYSLHDLLVRWTRGFKTSDADHTSYRRPHSVSIYVDGTSIPVLNLNFSSDCSVHLH